MIVTQSKWCIVRSEANCLWLDLVEYVAHCYRGSLRSWPFRSDCALTKAFIVCWMINDKGQLAHDRSAEREKWNTNKKNTKLVEPVIIQYFHQSIRYAYNNNKNSPDRIQAVSLISSFFLSSNPSREPRKRNKNTSILIWQQ